MSSEAGETEGLEVAVEEREAWMRRLTVTVGAERVRRARRRELRGIARSVRLKGFRKGKVPDRVIEERFGPAVDERTLRTLIDDAFGQALDQRGLQPVGDPTFGDIRYEPGESLTFQVEFEVLPELHLERLGGFRIERPSVEVSDQDVDAVLERMREERAVRVAVERRPAEGDLVSVRIARLEEDDGEPSEPRPYRFELGRGYAIPAVEEAIRGLAPGEEGTFEISFPADFDDEELAGSTRRLAIVLVEVKEKRLPDLDDEFAREVGDLDSLQALREAIAGDLRSAAEEEAEETVRRRLLDHLVEANPFEVPPTMIERYLDRVIEAPEDADPERVDAARRELRPAVERRLKHDLVLDALIEREGFEATGEEVEGRLAEIAERRGWTVSEARRRLVRGNGLEELRRTLAAEKVHAWLLSRSEVS